MNLKAKLALGLGLLATLLNLVVVPLLNGGAPDYSTAIAALVSVAGALYLPVPGAPK